MAKSVPMANPDDLIPSREVAEILDERKIDVARGAYLGPIEILASDAIISRLITSSVLRPSPNARKRIAAALTAS